MEIQKDNSHKKALFVGSILGLIQLSYIIVSGIMTDWVEVSDPLAHLIFYNIILPFSIFLFFMSVLAGYLYPTTNYKKPIKYSLVISFIISLLISLGIFFSGAASFSDIFGFIFGILIISSPLLLLIALVLVKWEVIS